MNCSTPGLPVHYQLLESTQTHVSWVSDTIQPHHPLSSPSPPALNLSQHQGIFKWVSSSHQVDLDTPQIFHSKLHLFVGGSGGVLELAWLARTADCQILGVWAGCQTWSLLKIKLCKFTIKLIIFKANKINIQNLSLFYSLLEVIYMLYLKRGNSTEQRCWSHFDSNWQRWEYVYHGNCQCNWRKLGLLFCWLSRLVVMN